MTLTFSYKIRLSCVPVATQQFVAVYTRQEWNSLEQLGTNLTFQENKHHILLSKNVYACSLLFGKNER